MEIIGTLWNIQLIAWGASGRRFKSSRPDQMQMLFDDSQYRA